MGKQLSPRQRVCLQLPSKAERLHGLRVQVLLLVMAHRRNMKSGSACVHVY